MGLVFPSRRPLNSGPLSAKQSASKAAPCAGNRAARTVWRQAATDAKPRSR